ncbi:dipeptidyl peptidase IV N-terminal region-domain-containing protein [Chytridium lagenaria]|nr:dipeptidyl peptidase IV N-terminal region-domain-containing protein [Chytridium lagenaria]
MNGVAEYIMQEEFHRFTGYWWAPLDSKDTLRPEEREDKLESILYLESNASVEIKIVSFDPALLNSWSHGRFNLKRLFSWLEYIPRVGWLPDGQGKSFIWAQLLDRPQKRIALIEIPISFHDSHEYQATLSTDSPPLSSFSAKTNPQFIWASERTGYRHLYHISCSIDTDSSSAVKKLPARIRKITSGPWQVVDGRISVDEASKLVYFVGKADTPIELQIYRLTPLGQSHDMIMNESCTLYISTTSSVYHFPFQELHSIHRTHTSRKPPSSHHVYKKFHLSPDASISPDSSTDHTYASDIPATEPTSVGSQKRRNSSPEDAPDGADILTITAQKVSSLLPSRLPSEEIMPPYWNPEFFSFINSDGVELFGMIYKPKNYKEGVKYPVIVRVYGGPNVQVVTNDYKYPKFMRVFLALQFG